MRTVNKAACARPRVGMTRGDGVSSLLARTCCRRAPPAEVTHISELRCVNDVSSTPPFLTWRLEVRTTPWRIRSTSASCSCGSTLCNSSTPHELSSPPVTAAPIIGASATKRPRAMCRGSVVTVRAFLFCAFQPEVPVTKPPPKPAKRLEHEWARAQRHRREPRPRRKDAAQSYCDRALLVDAGPADDTLQAKVQSTWRLPRFVRVTMPRFV